MWLHNLSDIPMGTGAIPIYHFVTKFLAILAVAASKWAHTQSEVVASNKMAPLTEWNESNRNELNWIGFARNRCNKFTWFLSTRHNFLSLQSRTLNPYIYCCDKIAFKPPFSWAIIIAWPRRCLVQLWFGHCNRFSGAFVIVLTETIVKPILIFVQWKSSTL